MDPLCGGTRSVYLTQGGELRETVRYNPAVSLLVVAAAVVVLRAVVGWTSRYCTPYPAGGESSTAGSIMALRICPRRALPNSRLCLGSSAAASGREYRGVLSCGSDAPLFSPPVMGVDHSRRPRPCATPAAPGHRPELQWQGDRPPGAN
nr:DUF2752 domain-containing protein [Mycolicibacterium moriokaense]